MNKPNFTQMAIIAGDLGTSVARVESLLQADCTLQRLRDSYARYSRGDLSAEEFEGTCAEVLTDH